MPKDEADSEDPNELVGVSLGGGDADEEEMAACIVDEYVRMGFGRAEVLKMFSDPFYRLTHGVQARRGAAWVQDLVDRVFRRWSGGTTWPT